jgi:acetyl-CoA carboxylase biotin carboxylase subunit
VFKKILIANRGEIACRIIRTCRKLGIQTVAVYSEADRDALHVRMADEAYLLGEAPPGQSYLNIPRIMEAVRHSGAEAVHPGYGFLSECPAFARSCQDAGICFIGPSPGVMEEMGDKLGARKLARKAGLPVMPGTWEAVDDTQAEQTAWKLGFPLMVKAAEGGGGIGIHVVHSMEELRPVIQRTREVCNGAFGSPRLYFERYLSGASHIEVQLIGDQHGNLVHLFERDCSIQRRNQKLVEETPAVKLSPRLRRRICHLALKLAKYIGYTNAGTVEFLVSPDGQLFFLEINARLQVEHGVTEMITGLDMVELQIRVAAGESLPVRQEDVVASGHAIEARIYPEDPSTCIPQVGDLRGLHLPTGEHVRVDSALCAGYRVGLHYDPLLAKVMVWGENREESVKRLLRALLSVRLEGLTHNVPLLRDVLMSKEFVGATHHTGSLAHLIEDRNNQATSPNGNGAMSSNGHSVPISTEGGREVAAAIAVAMAMAMKANTPATAPSYAPNVWRSYGRRAQLLSRTMGGSRGWR